MTVSVSLLRTEKTSQTFWTSSFQFWENTLVKEKHLIKHCSQLKREMHVGLFSNMLFDKMFECEQIFGSFKNSLMGVERCPIGPSGASLISDKRVCFWVVVSDWPQKSFGLTSLWKSIQCKEYVRTELDKRRRSVEHSSISQKYLNQYHTKY